MTRVTMAVLAVSVAAVASATQFQRFLSPDRPSDRAILNYMALEQAGQATSMDLANMAVLIYDKGFPADAATYLKAALKKDPHNFEAAYRLGLVLQRMGDDREAMHAYKRCLKERPGYAQARFMLALAEERCGQRTAAIDDYAKAYKHAPELANAAKNPLIYDSDLQLSAILKYYQEQVMGMTLKVTVPDPGAAHRMAEKPLPTPTPTPAPQPTPAPKPGSARTAPAPAPTPKP